MCPSIGNNFFATGGGAVLLTYFAFFRLLCLATYLPIHKWLWLPLLPYCVPTYPSPTAIVSRTAYLPIRYAYLAVLE